MDKYQALVKTWNENNDESDCIIIPRAAAESIRSTLAAVSTKERAVWVCGSLYTYLDMMLHMQPRKETLS